MKAGRTLREQHFDSSGKERVKFSSHWRARRYIEKRGLIGVESFYCEACRTVHIVCEVKVATNVLALPGL